MSPSVSLHKAEKNDSDECTEISRNDDHKKQILTSY